MHKVNTILRRCIKPEQLTALEPEDLRRVQTPPQDDAHHQRLHLVFGGELTSLTSHEFRDLSALDIVGVFPNYASALEAWKGAAQRTVDNAMTRYFIVHLHRLLEPESSERQGPA